MLKGSIPRGPIFLLVALLLGSFLFLMCRLLDIFCPCCVLDCPREHAPFPLDTTKFTSHIIQLLHWVAAGFTSQVQYTIGRVFLRLL